MSSGDLVRFDAFANEMFLSYLTKHAIWGGPASISLQERNWTPEPTTTLITKAARQRFRDTVERLAYAVALDKKLGGVTFARKVRELYETTFNQVGEAHKSAYTKLLEREWNFIVAKSEEGFVLDVIQKGGTAGASITGRSADGMNFIPRIAPDRRRFFSLAATFPAALMPPANTVRTKETCITSSNVSSLSDERRFLTDRLVDDAANAANSLLQLLADPTSGFRLTGKTTRAGSHIVDLNESAFLSAFELANILTATIDHETCNPKELDDCRRYTTRAKEDKHIRYHSSLAKMLVQSISDHHTSGTNWFGPYAPTPSTHSHLVTCAIFDLENHRNAINGRENLIETHGDPFTLEYEAQLVLGPFLFREEKPAKPYGNILRHWTVLLGRSWSSTRASKNEQSPPTHTHIWAI